MNVYVVTGGGSGIGASTVELILRRDPDARVAILDRTPGEAADERVLPLAVDVTDRSAVGEAFESITATWSEPIAGLVVCAGIQRRVPSVDLDEVTWDTVLGVHLGGSLWPAQAAARSMIEAGRGTIVLFSSIAERFAWPARLPYAVAKAGIGAMARTLAVEWAPHGIRVNAVAPGYVETPMVRAAVDSGALDGGSLAALHALERLASPEELAKAVHFLLSDESSFVTGETLFVDGGFSVRKVP